MNELSIATAANIAAATRGFAGCASRAPLVDCLSHAQAAEHLLERAGYMARVVAGFAAWRLHGQAPGAVVAHLVGEGCDLIPGQEGIAFHAWVEVLSPDGDSIFDVTAYQLAAKMAAIDASDGQITPIEWQGEFLLRKKVWLNTWPEVRDGSHAGAAFYAANEHTQTMLAGIETLEEDHRRGLEVAFDLLEAGLPLRIWGPQGTTSVRPSY